MRFYVSHDKVERSVNFLINIYHMVFTKFKDQLEKKPSRINDKQSLPVDGDAAVVSGETVPRRHVCSSELFIANDIQSLYHNFLLGCTISGNYQNIFLDFVLGDKPFLGKRSILNGELGPYTFRSYNDAFERAKKLGSALVTRGMEEQSCLGFCSINREEWVLAEQAAFMFNLNTVPLYDTLGKEAIVHIINETELKTIVASADKIDLLLELKPNLPSLTTIVSMDPVSEELCLRAKNNEVELLSFEELEIEGQKQIHKARPPKSDDIATICYTSGTTGISLLF